LRKRRDLIPSGKVLERRALAGRRGVAFIEDEVDDLKHRGEPLRELLAAWGLVGQPDSESVRFARTMRCAIVAVGSRKALAISSVVSQQIIRSARAARASRDRHG